VERTRQKNPFPKEAARRLAKMNKHPHDRLRQDFERRQRNTVWPDTVRNGRSVDAYLWKGSPDAPRVQRIGAFIWGAFFLSLGLMFAFFAATAPFWPLYAVAVGFGYVGCRMIRNTFLR
jgi:hypothetical protein